MRIEHKFTGADLFRRGDKPLDERSQKIIEEASRLAARNQRVAEQSAARMARAQECLGRAQERLEEAKREKKRRRVIHQLEKVVAARLFELQELARLMEQAPVGGILRSGRGSRVRALRKTPLP